MGRACSTHKGEEFIQGFGGKTEGKRQLRGSELRRGDNIKMDIREIEWNDTDWIHVIEDRDWWRTLVNTAMNLRVP
jgi:hypothetical protein